MTPEELLLNAIQLRLSAATEAYDRALSVPGPGAVESAVVGKLLDEGAVTLITALAKMRSP